MRIHSVQISNILSFKYHERIEDAPEIAFNEGLNILIGPNGSGKSNFLEVLNQIFQKFLFTGCQYLPERINNLEQRKQALAHADRGAATQIEKNWHFSEKPMSIRIILALGEQDLDNMRFVLDNCEEINSLFRSYCGESHVLIPDSAIDWKILANELKQIAVDFTGSANNKFDVAIRYCDGRTLSSAEGNFVSSYLKFFEYVQCAIELHNQLNQQSVTGGAWMPLKRTFGILGCYRNYNSFDSKHVVSENPENEYRTTEATLRTESTRRADDGSPKQFSWAKIKLSYPYHELHHEFGKYAAEAKIRDNPLFTRIDKLLNDYLALSLVIDRPNDKKLEQNFSFLRNGSRVEVASLSAGEKGILHCIMSVAAYDIQNGLLVIDEPELHLHPQLQKKMLRLMQDVAGEFHVQIIFATHSPIFVTAKTITNVRRFSFDRIQKTTLAHIPRTTPEQKELVRYLSYSNSSKIFFSDRVVLVEGDNDERFFRGYFSDYFARMGGTSRVLADDIEFLAIGGKDKRIQWTDFLKSFGITVSFIGDLDNLAEMGVLSSAELNAAKIAMREAVLKKINDQITSAGSKDGAALLKCLDDYLSSGAVDTTQLENLRRLWTHILEHNTPTAKLLDQIKSTNPDRYGEVLKRITDEYVNGIFILRVGRLEDYLECSHNKTTEKVLEICADLPKWRIEKAALASELDTIFDRIMEAPFQI